MSSVVEDRRSANIEILLVEVGKLHEMIKNTQTQVGDLSVKVGIQNGRVGKLEKWQSYLYGIATILTVLVVPICIKYFPDFMNALLNR